MHALDQCEATLPLYVKAIITYFHEAIAVATVRCPLFDDDCHLVDTHILLYIRYVALNSQPEAPVQPRYGTAAAPAAAAGDGSTEGKQRSIARVWLG